jgi:two-component system, chemotaxis family, CheB/CheR fusion protein
VGGMATWDWDMVSGRVIWSEEHYRMEGYAPGEIEPSFEAWAARVHPDDLQETLDVINAAAEGSGNYAHAFRVVHPDGKIVWCEARGRFFYDSAAKPVRMLGVMNDVTESRTSADRQQALLDRQMVLVAELQHRTRNLLAVVGSIAKQTAGDCVDTFRLLFEDRLAALSRVQGLLSRSGEAPITIGALIRMELDALGVDDWADRISLNGPEAPLRNSTVQTLSLALHELATNARKHGAMAHEGGHLAIQWRVLPYNGDEERLRLEWLETGLNGAGAGPVGRGYGRELLERALPYSLGAETSFDLSDGRLLCTIDVPLKRKRGACAQEPS